MDPETKFKVQNSGKNIINIDTDDDSEQKSQDSDEHEKVKKLDEQPSQIDLVDQIHFERPINNLTPRPSVGNRPKVHIKLKKDIGRFL